jgi:hypothetical protein
MSMLMGSGIRDTRTRCKRLRVDWVGCRFSLCRLRLRSWSYRKSRFWGISLSVARWFQAMIVEYKESLLALVIDQVCLG